MIDIHCHIIPAIDDGADKLETSLEMINIAKNDNIKKIIATPHYSTGRYENTYARVCEAVLSLNREITQRGIEFEVLVGQEVFLEKKTVQLYKAGIVKGLNNSRYMLVELPFDNIPEYTMDVLYELRICGIVPVLAHPERYEFIIKKPSLINDFIVEGCLFQINSHSVMGLFGKDVKKTSELLIENGICHFIASDAHGIGGRKPEVEKAYDKIQQINNEICRTLIENAHKLSNDETITQMVQKLQHKKSLFEFFK